MGSKERLLTDLVRRDRRIQILHDHLIETGLQWRGPSNTVTLLYHYRHDGKNIPVAALRGSPSIYSFPARFWLDHSGPLREALSLAGVHQVQTEGFISSSQYSAGQIRISDATMPIIAEIIDGIVVLECNDSGADLSPRGSPG